MDKRSKTLPSSKPRTHRKGCSISCKYDNPTRKRKPKRGTEDDDMDDTAGDKDRTAEELQAIQSLCPGVFHRM
ncbi:MAG: hypothetical protein LQ338_002298 [Usnochroma carphineum]|nr:MAG: hypothetical protein LQ338_002298 [Usnochroma carphineum]